jgi:invasion protein IalB
MKRVLVLFSLIATYVVSGIGAAEATDPRATQLTYEPWTKICITGSYCIVGAGAQGACYPSGGVLYIAMPDEKSANLSASLGTRALEGGISVQIDQGDPILIPRLECFANGCGGRVEIDSAVIENLKRSQTVTIQATAPAHQKISVSLSLAGFANAYDGPGTEPKVLEETVSSEKMKELMQREEEERRERECKE